MFLRADSVFVLDRTKPKVTAQWKLTKAKVNYTMATDETHDRLFVGCREPASVVVFDSKTGREITTFPIGGETDCIFYDGAHRRIYVTGAEGMLDVVEQVDADHYLARENHDSSRAICLRIAKQPSQQDILTSARSAILEMFKVI